MWEHYFFSDGFFIHNVRDKLIHGHSGDVFYTCGYGCQPGNDEVQHADIVKAHDTHVAGRFNLNILEVAHDVKGVDVAGAEDRCTFGRFPQAEGKLLNIVIACDDLAPYFRMKIQLSVKAYVALYM